MIEVEHISRSFGTFRAVDDISFSIKTGEIVGLLGPNGAGKTTTMRMITGFIAQTSGRILIDGKDISENPAEAKQKIGYMPESAPLYSDMIVADYLAYVAEMHQLEPEQKVPHLAEICGLKEVMHKNIGDLSRGYRQRVGLAHALMNDPEILILDEPTSGLDPNQIGDVRNLIKEIGKTRTVIISTHILGEVEMLCDRIIIISKGKIAADSPTAELRSRYGNAASIEVTAGGCTSQELADALASVLKDRQNVSVAPCACTEHLAGEMKSGAVSVSADGSMEIRPEIVRTIAGKGWNLYTIKLERNSLEDVFRALTTGAADFAAPADSPAPTVDSGSGDVK